MAREERATRVGRVMLQLTLVAIAGAMLAQGILFSLKSPAGTAAGEGGSAQVAQALR